MYQPLRHEDAENKSDEQLAAEAEACLASDKSRQFSVTLVNTAFAPGFTWLTYDMQRDGYPALERIPDLEQRKDLRQIVVTSLTGMLKNMARRRAIKDQAELLDASIQDGDRTVNHFVEAFLPEVTAVYGRMPKLWKLFMNNFPWLREKDPRNENDPEYGALVGVLTNLAMALIKDRGVLGQIMTDLRLRMLVDEHDWQTMVPLERRIAVAKAKNEQELTTPDKPFTARQEIEIVTLQVIFENIPFHRLKPIFEEAEKLLDFVIPPPPPEPVVEEKKDEPTTEATETKVDDKPAEDAVSPLADSAPPKADDEKKTEDESSNTDAVISVAEEELSDDVVPPPSNVPPADEPKTSEPPPKEEASAKSNDQGLDDLFDDIQKKPNGDSAPKPMPDGGVSPENSGQDATPRQTPPPLPKGSRHTTSPRRGNDGR